MDYSELLDLLKTRRSVRAFTSDPVSDDAVDRIFEAARWAPSGANSQPWEFVVIREQQTKDRMAEIVREHMELGHKAELTRAAGTALALGRTARDRSRLEELSRADPGLRRPACKQVLPAPHLSGARTVTLHFRAGRRLSLHDSGGDGTRIGVPLGERGRKRLLLGPDQRASRDSRGLRHLRHVGASATRPCSRPPAWCASARPSPITSGTRRRNIGPTSRSASTSSAFGPSPEHVPSGGRG